MNKKRTLVVVMLVLVTALSVAMLTSCGGANVEMNNDFYPENYTKVDYSEMKEVKGMDAFKLMCEAYDNWTQDKGYKRTQQFTFKACLGSDDGPLAGEQNTLDVYKIDGEKLYRRMVKIQGGTFADKLNEVTRLYYDGSTAKWAVKNDKKNVPANKDDFFKVIEEPAMGEYDGAKPIADELKTYKEHMTTYVWRDKANLVDNGFKVYKDKDGTLRFTIEINCSDEMMKTVHKEAWKEFEKNTGAEKDSIKLRENTTIDFAVREIDGKKKIVAWRRTEIYSGAKMGQDLIKARQTSIETFSYDKNDYTITADDIK